MKVLLIYPPATVYGSGILRPSIPLGLLYLTAFLKTKNVEVKFLDALAEDADRVVKNGSGRKFGMSFKAIKKVIGEFNPDIVGISTMYTAYIDDSLALAKFVKGLNKKIMVVLGGSHVSVDPVTIAKNKYVDVAVFGEGENTLYELTQNKDWSQIDGIAYKKGKKIIKNKARELIKDISVLPYPAWEDLNVEKYKYGGAFNMRYPCFPIVSSRGCPGHCLYCSVNAVWCYKWRGRNASNVVDEMEMLIQKFGAKEFSFQDDSVSVDVNRLEEICKEIIKRKLNIKWTTPNGIAHWTLNKKILKLMKEAGCYRITFGIESGDPELRRWVGKPYNLDQAKELTEYANKLGFWTLATNIIGFPYETKEQMLSTFNFALKSDVDLAFFFRLGPRPGTPIYEMFKKEGWLMKDKHMLFSEDVACRTKYFTGEEILEWQRYLSKNFLIKRWLSFNSILRIARKIRSFEDFCYILKIAWSGIKLSKNLVVVKKGINSKSFSV